VTNPQSADGVLSEGQVAKATGLDLVQVRALADRLAEQKLPTGDPNNG
jgi:hypothetical protein